jgi:hypothetical protein
MNTQRSKLIPDQVDPPRTKHAQMEPRLVVLELYTVFRDEERTKMPPLLPEALHTQWGRVWRTTWALSS